MYRAGRVEAQVWVTSNLSHAASLLWRHRLGPGWEAWEPWAGGGKSLRQKSPLKQAGQTATPARRASRADLLTCSGSACGQALQLASVCM